MHKLNKKKHVAVCVDRTGQWMGNGWWIYPIRSEERIERQLNVLQWMDGIDRILSVCTCSKKVNIKNKKNSTKRRNSQQTRCQTTNADGNGDRESAVSNGRHQLYSSCHWILWFVFKKKIFFFSPVSLQCKFLAMLRPQKNIK